MHAGNGLIRRVMRLGLFVPAVMVMLLPPEAMAQRAPDLDHSSLSFDSTIVLPYYTRAFTLNDSLTRSDGQSYTVTYQADPPPNATGGFYGQLMYQGWLGRDQFDQTKNELLAEGGCDAAAALCKWTTDLFGNPQAGPPNRALIQAGDDTRPVLAYWSLHGSGSPGPVRLITWYDPDADTTYLQTELGAVVRANEFASPDAVSKFIAGCLDQADPNSSDLCWHI